MPYETYIGPQTAPVAPFPRPLGVVVVAAVLLTPRCVCDHGIDNRGVL